MMVGNDKGEEVIVENFIMNKTAVVSIFGKAHVYYVGGSGSAMPYHLQMVLPSSLLR